MLLRGAFGTHTLMEQCQRSTKMSPCIASVRYPETPSLVALHKMSSCIQESLIELFAEARILAGVQVYCLYFQ